MKETVQKELDILFFNYPELAVCRNDIVAAFGHMLECSRQKGLIMTCGNGGSAADAGHIVGELMKGFKQKRPLTPAEYETLQNAFPHHAGYLAAHLQRAIPALSLSDHTALTSAFINDVAPDMVFAQQVFGYGKAGDVLIALSTSGNSRNVVNACRVANAFRLKTIGMTGESGGEMRDLCSVTIRVPARETYRIQEYHLPVYHALCSMLEAASYS
ncbi:MAG: SIS domain-containing protein [Tannerellaceae bacterium]|jgi:D-sedoheptulose 7-phosphate isomerase|nr:SIS domain-containing protein [Tannerellaceae bacterium]